MEPRGAICEYDSKETARPCGFLSGVSMIRPVVADMILKIGSPSFASHRRLAAARHEDLRASGISDVVWASRTLKRT